MRLQQIARPVLGALLIAALVAPVAAQAQPSYAHRDESIRGRISSFDGHYQLMLKDERGFVDRVALREGTIIQPTGLRLSRGMSVTIRGHNDGASFTAFEIDVPNNSASAYGPGYAPYPEQYVYPSYPVYNPYPVYVYPYYPYYPSFSLRIGFGGRGFFGRSGFRR
jgi:hypothetical protein